MSEVLRPLTFVVSGDGNSGYFVLEGAGRSLDFYSQASACIQIDSLVRDEELTEAQVFNVRIQVSASSLPVDFTDKDIEELGPVPVISSIFV